MARLDNEWRGNVKIAFLSSVRAQCGIANYTTYLGEALQRKGHSVWIVNSAHPNWDDIRNTVKELMARDRFDILHIQFESLISGSWAQNKLLIDELRTMKSDLSVFVTLHRTGEDTVEGAKSLGNVQILVSQEHAFHHVPNLHIAQMGCLMYPEVDMSMTRRDLGIPPDATVLTSFGFLSPWKKTDALVAELVPQIVREPNYVLQILGSFNTFDGNGDGNRMADNINRTIANYGAQRQVIFVSGWLGREELNRRLAISDWGFIWSPMHTGSTSAANKDYVSARCPLVVSDSNHHWDLRKGVVRTPGLDMNQFVIHLMAVARDRDLQRRLKDEMRHLYDEINWDAAIERHIQLYRGTLSPVPA